MGAARHNQCVLLDWGDTVMRVFTEYSGPMEHWPKVEAVPSVSEAVTQIRHDALVCLATNAADSGERAIRNALNRVGLDGLFDRIFCLEVVGYRKPSEAYYQTVLRKLDLPPERVFMVGDDFEVDVLGATAVGIRSVWLNRASEDDRLGALHATVFALDSLVGALDSLGLHRA
jgi:HAD superfamily hydrolase (TIGR01509 family)